MALFACMLCESSQATLPTDLSHVVAHGQCRQCCPPILVAAFKRYAHDMTPARASAWLVSRMLCCSWPELLWDCLFAACLPHTSMSALQVGCAQLGVAPPAATIEACLATLERQAGSARPAANITWALAVLEVRRACWCAVFIHDATVA